MWCIMFVKYTHTYKEERLEIRMLIEGDILLLSKILKIFFVKQLLLDTEFKNCLGQWSVFLLSLKKVWGKKNISLKGCEEEGNLIKIDI